MALIECKNIIKKFGSKTALDDVSLDIPKGKIFGLLGPNGAGKTTLIRIMNRIIAPNSGQVLFNGHPIEQKDVEKIGYLPEERGLYRKMKVGDQVMYLAELKGMKTDDARREFALWFRKFGIEDWWEKKVEELSKGMAQKVQFISTVVHRPSLMILDEPFSGFDPVNAELIRQEILKLKDEGATIILSTHNMESVEELCDHIALINSSQLVVSGELDAIRRKYGQNNIELIYSGEKISDKPGVFSVLSDEENTGRHTAVLAIESQENNEAKSAINAVLQVLIGENITINSFRELIPRMNDIFIKLVTGKDKVHLN